MSRRRSSRSLVMKLGPLTLWLLFLLVPLAFSLTARENFRLPKLLLSECLGLASLVFLAWRLKTIERIDWRGLWRQPVIVAVLPMLAVATSGLLTSDHSLHVREGLVSLWIGIACLVTWSLALTEKEHRDLLQGLIFPATQLALVAILQFHRIFNPFRFERQVAERIGLTSFAGSAFDLAAYLVLPCLIVQASIRRGTAPRWRWAQGLAAVLCIYALALTQTLTAIAAFVVGTLVLWLLLLPRRRFAAFVAAVVVAALALGLAIEPLRLRVERKLESLQHGHVNNLMSGRLDGWHAAVWMLREHPWTGVGHGAYRAEFGQAKQDLKLQGVNFYRAQHQAYFVNAHNDLLEALAEWGVPGAVALLWLIYVLARTLRRLWAAGKCEEAAEMGAGLAALAIMALTNFPLRIALVAYPALLFVSWIFAAAREVEG